MLQAARMAFAENGYAGASLASLAERIGLTKAAVLHHFASKDALYKEVLAVTLQSLIEPVTAAALGPGSYVDRLDRLTAAIVSELSEHPASAKLLIREILGRGPFIEGEGGQAVRAGIGAIASFFDAGMREGAFIQQDATQLTWSVIGVHLLSFAANDVDALQPVLPDVHGRREAALRHVRSMTLA